MRSPFEDLPYVEFDAPVTMLTWGRSTYVILVADDELVEAAATLRTRRAEGWLDDVLVNVGLNKSDQGPESFIYVGKPLQRRLQVRVGDLVSCRLRPADPDLVLIPDDVLTALQEAALLDRFEDRRPAQQRQLLQPIEAAAQPATRARRIAALISELG